MCKKAVLALKLKLLKRWLYLINAGDSSERGRNAANLISDGGGLFLPFFLELVPWFCFSS